MIRVLIIFLFGILTVEFFPYSIPIKYLYCVLAILIILVIYLKNSKIILTITPFMLGFILVQLHTYHYLENRFPEILEKKKILILGDITSIPSCNNNTCQFEFESKQFGILKLNWCNMDNDTKLIAGDYWQLEVILKRPHGYVNPGSFDLEKFYFSRKVQATGNINKSIENKNIPRKSKNISLNRIRQKISDLISDKLENKKYINFLLALTLGIKVNIDRDQLNVLQNTGTSHLFSISGLHVGFISLCVYKFILLLCNKSKYITKYIYNNNKSSLNIASLGSLLAAIVYSMLSGMQIPTVRAVIMLSVFILNKIYYKRITSINCLLISLLIILIINPFAVLSAGFWMSYIAVIILIYSFYDKYNNKKNINNSKYVKFISLLKMQIVLLIGLLPLNLAYFSKIALIAPIANIIVVPIVSLLVIPLSLMGVIIISFIPLIGKMLLVASAKIFSLVWKILFHLNKIDFTNIIFYKPDLLLLIIIFIGALWLLSARGFPGKKLSVICFLPILFPSKLSLSNGEFKFTLLDVGQGLASIIQTKNHVLIYDAGPKIFNGQDLGEMVVVPFLQNQHINKVNTLIISHPDLDHIGGLNSILDYVSVNSIIINDPSFLENKLVKYKSNILPCLSGDNWQWDGVNFEILHPSTTVEGGKNEYSCVIKISNTRHSVLLTGDIGVETEHKLLLKYKNTDMMRSDILVAPHHGSGHSSSIEFIKSVNAKYVLFPAGYLNRYGHPVKNILNRYIEHGSNIMVSYNTGAISFVLHNKPDNLSFSNEREIRNKIWYNKKD